MLIRSLQGLGDTTYSDAEGFTVTAPDSSSDSSYFGDDLGSVADASGAMASDAFWSANNAIEGGVTDALSALGSAIGAGLKSVANAVPWWVWVGGAGVAFLAFHHEFER